MSLLLAVLLQSAAVPGPVTAAPRADPLAAGSAVLKKTIVDAIRNCPASSETEIGVCAPDRGFAEKSGFRLQPLKKPVVPSSPGVTVRIDGACDDPAGCRKPVEDDDKVDAATRERLTRRPRP